MSNLVADLKADHLQLAAALERIDAIGVGTREGRQVALEMKEALLAHMAREDRDLYPRLKQASQTDNRLRILLTVLASDLAEVTAVAMGFFAKLEGTSSIEIAGEYGRLVAALGTRIRREETTLFPEFDRVEQAAGR